MRVHNHAEDPWDHSNLTTTTPDEVEIINEIYSDELIDRMVESVLKRRLDDYARTPDFDDVMASTRLAVIDGLYPHDRRRPRLRNGVVTAGERAREAFHRAFHLARISAAGISFDDHPEHRPCQIFLGLRMPPPTHAQMAAHIIAVLVPSQP